MRDGAVVALEEVLAADLPVRLELRLDAKAELQRVDVENLSQLRRHIAEHLGERRRIDVWIHEDERPPRVHPDWRESELLGVEARLAVGAWRRAQASVEPVGPRVVRALERRAATR